MNETKEGNSSGDEIRFVQQLIASVEAVACRDKVYASTLLSELRAKALVFGSSFQRVASCSVQALCDRLVLVQLLGGVWILGQGEKPVPGLGTTASERERRPSALFMRFAPISSFVTL